MPTSTVRTAKGPRSLVRSAQRIASPRWQFLRGFLKHPVMVGSIIPSSRVLIEKMLKPVDWENTKLFVEYGPGVGTFTRPILEKLGPDATLLTIRDPEVMLTARKTAWGTRSGRVDDGLGFRIIGTIGSPQPSGIPVCTEVERIGAAAAAGSELGVAA